MTDGTGVDHELSLAEIAMECGVHGSTVRYWVTGGRLAAHRNGGRKWLVYRRDLEQMLRDEPSLGHPRDGHQNEPALPSDWSDSEHEASFALASSTGTRRQR